MNNATRVANNLVVKPRDLGCSIALRNHLAYILTCKQTCIIMSQEYSNGIFWCSFKSLSDLFFLYQDIVSNWRSWIGVRIKRPTRDSCLYLGEREEILGPPALPASAFSIAYYSRYFTQNKQANFLKHKTL